MLRAVECKYTASEVDLQSMADTVIDVDYDTADCYYLERKRTILWALKTFLLSNSWFKKLQHDFKGNRYLPLKNDTVSRSIDMNFETLSAKCLPEPDSSIKMIDSLLPKLVDNNWLMMEFMILPPKRITPIGQTRRDVTILTEVQQMEVNQFAKRVLRDIWDPQSMKLTAKLTVIWNFFKRVKKNSFDNVIIIQLCRARFWYSFWPPPLLVSIF